MWSLETVELQSRYYLLYGATQSAIITGVGTLVAREWLSGAAVAWLLIAVQVALTVIWRRSARKYQAATQAEIAALRVECASHAAALKARMGAQQ